MSGAAENKGTWKEWEYEGLEEPPLLTRDELLEALERLGLSGITERDLRFWETWEPKKAAKAGPKGVLPGPIRRRYQGATRALYPTWQVNLIVALRNFQQRGYDLVELPERMRLMARYFSYMEEVLGHPSVDDEDISWRAELPPRFPFGGEAIEWFDDEVAPAIAPMLYSYAERFEKIEKTRFVRAEIKMIDAHGKTAVFHIPLLRSVSQKATDS